MKKVISILFSMCLAATVHAQGLPALLIPTDSRNLAMGGVNLQPEYSQLDGGAYFGKWAPGTANSTVIGADVWFNVGSKLALFAGGKYLMDPAYGVSGEDGVVKSQFKPYDLMISLGAAYNITPALSAGLKLCNITSAIADKATGSAFCGDVFAVYKAEKWSAGIEGRNIGTNINYGAGDWPLPALVAVNGSVRPVEGLTAAAEFDYLFNGAVMAGAGAEYGFRDMVFARAGFHYGDNAKALPSFLSLGLGGKFKGIRLDATYILLSDTIGNSVMVSLRYAM